MDGDVRMGRHADGKDGSDGNSERRTIAKERYDLAKPDDLTSPGIREGIRCKVLKGISPNYP